jgi:imidazolonepropionase-like amidohydrolase
MRSLLTIGGLAAASLLALAAGSRATEGTVVFINARVLERDASRFSQPATLVVRDGRVESITGNAKAPAGANTVDLAGKFVMPGLVCAHAHVSDVQGTAPRAYTDANTIRQLRLYAQYGVTSVWSLGGEQGPAFTAREEQSTPALDRARLFLAGDIVAARTPEQAREQVAAVAAKNVDVIKIRVDDNLGTAQKMPPEVFRAVIDEAHKRNLRVAAHLFYLDDAKELLRAGVDVIAHSVRDREIDDEFIAMMKARRVPYVPTLTREVSTFIYASTPDFFADPFFLRGADRAVMAQLQEPARQSAMAASKSAHAYKAALGIAQRNLKKAADNGVLIAMGTDSGAFAERFQGFFEHLELDYMAQAGLTPAQILRASTSDAAAAMRVKDIGALVPGAWADLLVLDRDPLENIRNTRAISSVWAAGNVIK